MDVDNLLAGQRFDEALAKALAICDVKLASQQLFQAVVRFPSSATNNPVLNRPQYLEEPVGGPLIRRVKKFAERVARDNVAVPTIEYTIVFAIVMALVLTSAAYAGAWIAEKWFILTAKLT
jgi:hypothetical protein